MKRRDRLERQLLQAIEADDSELYDLPEHFVDMYKAGFSYADGIDVCFPDHIEQLGHDLCAADIRCSELGEKEWLRAGFQVIY